MTQVVLIDGEEQSKITIFNRNMQFGDGLFETCVAQKNKILFWPNHFARLNIGCKRLNIKKVNESDWVNDLNKAFALFAHSKCIVKLILSRGESSRGYGYEEDIVPVRIVIISKMKKTIVLGALLLLIAFCSTTTSLAVVYKFNKKPK